jgi:hypothetical protein
MSAAMVFDGAVDSSATLVFDDTLGRRQGGAHLKSSSKAALRSRLRTPTHIDLRWNWLSPHLLARETWSHCITLVSSIAAL